MRIHLTIPGEPMGKQRPRWGKWGTYTPMATVNYETYIKELFVIEHPDFKPMEGPLKIQLIAWLAIPASASKKRKTQMKDNQILPTKRPDVDNITKIFLDALQGIAFKNDSQVIDVSASKYYSSQPRLEVIIEEIK